MDSVLDLKWISQTEEHATSYFLLFSAVSSLGGKFLTYQVDRFMHYLEIAYCSMSLGRWNERRRKAEEFCCDYDYHGHERV